MVGASLFVGVGRVEDEFMDEAIPSEVDMVLEGLGGRGFTSLVEVSEGRALTKTRLSWRILTFSSGIYSSAFLGGSSLSLL